LRGALLSSNFFLYILPCRAKSNPRIGGGYVMGPAWGSVWSLLGRASGGVSTGGYPIRPPECVLRKKARSNFFLYILPCRAKSNPRIGGGYVMGPAWGSVWNPPSMASGRCPPGASQSDPRSVSFEKKGYVKDSDPPPRRNKPTGAPRFTAGPPRVCSPMPQYACPGDLRLAEVRRGPITPPHRRSPPRADS
jgi:hypothetical protein